jgi:hypothetical protein
MLKTNTIERTEKALSALNGKGTSAIVANTGPSGGDARGPMLPFDSAPNDTLE